MLAYIGLKPQKDIKWVMHPFAESTRLMAEGQIDAILAFPPRPRELRAKQIGHVVVNSMMDRPWSGYFCCIMYAHPEFVRQNPVATKRALRAILKATDVCAVEPERAAQHLVSRGFTPNFDYALQTMQEIPYGRWREYDPEDTVRFQALRLHEAGMIKSSPQKIIAQGANWRFLHELKKELKGETGTPHQGGFLPHSPLPGREGDEPRQPVNAPGLVQATAHAHHALRGMSAAVQPPIP